MSDKKRRDITLGEMQDECKKRDGLCCGMDSWESCKFFKVCPFQMQSRKALGWDLSDPPRFNEAQMALLKALQGVGARYVGRRNGELSAFDERSVHIPITKLLGIDDEDYVIAELLGKDGADESKT